MNTLREEAESICREAIRQSLPDTAVKKYLSQVRFGTGKLIVIAVGKAAWTMAAAAHEVLGSRISCGVVVTKYRHSKGPLPNTDIIEAGHPVPDENAFVGTRLAIERVSGLAENDTVLFLLSGGGSALFESSPLPLCELQEINRQLLACGADIREINTIRKRLSDVKGGRFARLCAPARIVSLMLSDIIGDQPDMIASGPVCPDPSTCTQAAAIAEKYRLHLSPEASRYLARETPKHLDNVQQHICGSVRQLCLAAAAHCRRLGYETILLTDSLTCTARDAGIFLSGIARYHAASKKRTAFIAGGETVVYLTGKGKGGRNQELALAAAEGIAGLPRTAVFSAGSDGTDGPTDAAGGYVDGNTREELASQGIRISDILRENDSYRALERCGGLIRTGPTGTNVNDLSVVLTGDP